MGDDWVMLGKTFKGMTDEMLAWQTERFLELETSRDGHVVHVRPEQVVEIAFDGLQRSTRYPGGLALRFARVLRYRDDKRAAEADTIDTVRALGRLGPPDPALHLGVQLGDGRGDAGGHEVAEPVVQVLADLRVGVGGVDVEHRAARALDLDVAVDRPDVHAHLDGRLLHRARGRLDEDRRAVRDPAQVDLDVELVRDRLGDLVDRDLDELTAHPFGGGFEFVRHPAICRPFVLNHVVDNQHRRCASLYSTNQLRKHPMSDQLSRVFAALADPTRRDMVARLTTSDATVGELADPYDVSVQAVSKHLKVLEDAGLVSRSREAQRRPVHLEAEVFDLMTKWIERYRRQAEERYSRLDAVLAELNEQEDPQTKEGTAS